GTGPPGNRCLSVPRGSGVRPILLHHAGGHLCPPGPHGRRPPGTSRGPLPDGATGGTLVGGRNLSPPGGLAPAAAAAATGGGGSLVAAGPGRRPPPGGQIAGATSCHESEPALASSG